MGCPPRVQRLAIAVALLAALSARTAAGRDAEDGDPVEGGHKGFKIEQIEMESSPTLGLMRVRAFTDTPAEATWAVLRDVQRWERALGLFSETELLESTPSRSRYRLHVSPPWPIRDFEAVVNVESPPGERLLLWTVEEGRIAGNFGKIRVQERPGGSRVIYESYGPPKNAFPPWMLRIGLRLILPSQLEDLHEAILEEMRSPAERAPADAR